MAILTCTCGAKNRLPSIPTRRIRCGKCQRAFMPAELAKAVPEAPPARSAPPGDFELEREDDGPPACPVICKKCNAEFDLENIDYDDDDRPCCPECGSKKLSGVPQEGLLP